MPAAKGREPASKAISVTNDLRTNRVLRRECPLWHNPGFAGADACPHAAHLREALPLPNPGPEFLSQKLRSVTIKTLFRVSRPERMSYTEDPTIM